MSAPLLIEIGCEEIPARMIAAAGDDLRSRLLAVLDQAGLSHGDAKSWGGTRRLAVYVASVSPGLERREETVLGPPVAAAFSAEGKPTPAGLGFAKKQGIDPSELKTVETAKGAYAGFRRNVAGRSLEQVLAEALPASVASMSFPKTMRWGNGTHRWVRPVHWVVALHGADVLELELLGAKSGRSSVGHRFLSPLPVAIDNADRYVDALREARVLVDPSERRTALLEALNKAAKTVKGELSEDAALLEELVELVEWPGVVVGQFDPGFLDLPREILETTLKHHQKSFSVRGPESLLPAFLAVANTDRDPAGHVRRGNEWVVSGRLEDARFFWNQDSGRSLAARVPDLDRVVFHQKVGSYRKTSDAIGFWAKEIAEKLELGDIDVARSVQASALCKADLVTGLVGEFPELQGVVGGLLLHREGGDPIVADAIADHYRPAGPGSPLPRSDVGCVVALGDRIQVIHALLAIGEMPTGSRDPFGLRRAANSVFRILIDRRWPIDLDWILARVTPAGDERQFWLDRLVNYLVDSGFTQPEVRAVLGVGDGNAAFSWPLHAIVERLSALQSVRASDDFKTLLLLTKRIHNIVPQVAKLELQWIEEGWQPQPPDYDQYVHPEPAARALRSAFETQEPKVDRAAAAGDYATAVFELTHLAKPVSKFFDDVLVIDEKQRDDTHHRSNLMGRLGALLTRYFDIRELAGQADSNR